MSKNKTLFIILTWLTWLIWHTYASSFIDTFQLTQIDQKIQKAIKNPKINKKIQQNKNKIDYLISLYTNSLTWLTLLLNWQKLKVDSKWIIKNDEENSIIIDLDYLFEKTIQLYNYDLSKFQVNFTLMRIFLEQIQEKQVCGNKIKLNQITFLFIASQNILINLTYEDFFRILACYVLKNKNKYQFSYEIKTYSPFYRQYNIKKWLELFNYYTWRKGEILDIWKILLEKDLKTQENLYITWYIIVNQKELKAYGWWLCWVSTLFYQALLRIKDIIFLERRNHSIFYEHLYQEKWQDATIYWNKNKPIITLKIKNNQQDFLIVPYTKGFKKRIFYTWLKLISLQPIQKVNVKLIKMVWKCAYVQRGEEIIKSCYKELKN